jgi:lysozyme
MAQKLSADGLKFIKQFEKFVAFIYDDFAPKKEWDGSKPKGTLTIGYGHTKAAPAPVKMTKGLRITEKEAADILDQDLGPDQAAVNSAVSVKLTQHQFDALVSFRFNTGRLLGTTLLKRVNAKQFDEVPAEFRKWVKSKNKVLEGLKNRREGEIKLWNKP